MKRWFALALLAFMLALVVSHVAVVRALPSFIMNRGMGMIADLGATENQWYTAPRITAATSAVVRSSPDLAYAACLLNVADGPVRIEVPAWDLYGSLSVFDGDTRNLFVGPLDQGAPVEVIVYRRGETISPPSTAQAIALSTDTGIALVRRLASTQALHTAAQALMVQSRCEAL